MTDQHHQTLPALRELQARPQWVCWRKEARKDDPTKYTKIPYNPRTGQKAKPNDPATWARYATAYATWQKAPETYDGIGYMFHRDLTGVDLDHCIDDHGKIEPWAWTIITHLASYAERSPSERGVHILLEGTVPTGIRRYIAKVLPHAHALHPEAAIEIYCEGRYFTITGQHIEGTPTTIEATRDALETLYATVTGAGETRVPAKQATYGPSLDNDTIIKKAMAASNGGRFRALWTNGDTTGYISASEADSALCTMLAFWTGKDPARIETLFQQSRLYRPEKWKKPTRTGETYGAGTIARAIAACTTVYHPTYKPVQLEREVERLLTQIDQHQAQLATKKRKPYQLVPKEIPAGKVLHYLGENEYGDAQFFAEAFVGLVCYDHTDKEWYLWNEHHWKRDATNKVRQLVAGVLGTLYLKVAADLNTERAELELTLKTRVNQGEGDGQIETLKDQNKRVQAQIAALHARANGLRTLRRINSVLTIAQTLLGITAEQWDTNPWLLAVPNGVLDLHTGTCRAGEPGEYIRTVAPTEWTGLKTPCPRFERFLAEIFEDRADRDELIAFLHRLLGYGITGIIETHIFPILYGEEGRNGKDTLLGILKAVLGALVGAISNDVFLAADKLRTGGAATPHLCDLQGKRLVWGSETKEGDRLNIAQNKHLTGGGDIPARQLHGRQYSFPPTHKLLLMTNYKPHAGARDKPFWTRACLIEFGIRFVDQPQAPNERQVDLALKETLKQERSGILAWLVRGCLAWQEQGLNMPDSVRMATSKYQEEEDTLLLFLQECCVITPNAYVKAGAFFKAYRDWYEANQFGGRSMNGKLFGDEMKKRFERKEGKTGRIYTGVGLLTSEPEPPTLFDDGGGSVEGALPDTIPHKAASEGVLQDRDGIIGGGCGGLSQVFSKKQEDRSPIGGKTWIDPPHPPPSHFVTINKPAPEATLQDMETGAAPSTDPPPGTGPYQCATRWEKHKKVAHEAIATRFSAGCWWCDRCDVQRAWMEYGEIQNYPRIVVQAHHFRVGQGREKWLRFAQEAGFTMVGHALEAVRPSESFEL